MVARKKIKKFICITCPKCCELETDGSEVSGAGCKRGKEFAIQEAILPLRVITTTIRCETENGTRMIPVKTAVPVPLEKIPDIMRHIKGAQFSKIPVLGSHVTVKGGHEALELIVTGE